jgi:hypothetical protein
VVQTKMNVALKEVADVKNEILLHLVNRLTNAVGSGLLWLMLLWKISHYKS